MFFLCEKEPQITRNGVVIYCFVFVARQHLRWHVGEELGSLTARMLRKCPPLWEDDQSVWRFAQSGCAHGASAA